jgi:small subunit ribosomal protein S4
MARYTGPTTKIARRFNEPLFGPSKALKKKPYAPGIHGKNKRRKVSEFGVQLMEKQKAKYLYGLLERQFRNLFERASKKSGKTGTILLQLLETRLDNVVYRLGIAPTRRNARQLVSHKHITVNGVVVNVPSYALKVGDVIGITPKSVDAEFVKSRIEGRTSKHSWLEWESATKQGKVVAMPEREEIPENIKEQLIVELYSK